MLESLEHRRLLSAAIEDGVLSVGGTNGDDEIRLTEAVSLNRIRVNVNGTVQDFDRREVGRVVINANAGDDRVVLGDDPSEFIGGFRPTFTIDTLVLGGRGQDTIYGGEANDTLDGGTGVNELHGRGGDDLFRAGNTDTDIFRGGRGTDTVDYTGRTQRLNITLDDVADDGAQWPPEMTIFDLFVPPPFIPERDNVHADIENVIGGSGADEITGNAANNILSGGGGDDMLFGGYGRDILNGNWGNDRLVGGRGGDLLIGGGWNDTADYSDHPGRVHVTLDGVQNDGLIELLVIGINPGSSSAVENDNIKGDVENVIGTIFDDHLVGNDASNTLDGRGGNDELMGGEGVDLLRGGEGDDRLYGADGSPDRLDGGLGDDLAQADHRDEVIGALRVGTIN